MEKSHRAELDGNPRAFFRQPGELQAYANAATAQSDMLVWHSSQRRDVSNHNNCATPRLFFFRLNRFLDWCLLAFSLHFSIHERRHCLLLCEQEATTSLLNRLPTRPYAESYDHPSWALANTYLTAQSPFLQHRHAQAQRRRLRFEVEDPLCGTLQRPQTTGPLRDAVTSAQQTAAATAAAKAMHWQSARPFTTTTGAAATAMAGAGTAGTESRASLSTPTLPARVRAKLSRAKSAAAVTHDQLLAFERKQHQKMNFQVRW